MNKQWILETVKTKYADLYLYNILEPNPDAGKSGVCYAGKYFSVASGLDSAENARLIAAAPEMLEAIKYSVDELRESWGNPKNALIALEKVLTKIEGGVR